MIFVRDHDDVAPTYIGVNIEEDLHFSSWVPIIAEIIMF